MKSAKSPIRVVVRIAVVLLSVVAVLVAVVTIKTVIETKRDTERFTTRKSPTPLIGGILSNLSVSEFKAFIEPHYSWEDISSSGKSDFGGWRPPLDVTNLLIRDYSHLGFKGRLVVNFFNDRLDAGIFFPKDFDGYLDALSSMIGKKIISDEEVYLPPHTRVWRAIAYPDNKYVGWEDKRLADELSEWVSKYSWVPERRPGRAEIRSWS